MARKKQKGIQEDTIKAFKKANRELQFLRNGGGQFVATDRPWKNRKLYDRKRDRRIDSDGFFLFIILFTSVLSPIK